MSVKSGISGVSNRVNAALKGYSPFQIVLGTGACIAAVIVGAKAISDPRGFVNNILGSSIRAFKFIPGVEGALKAENEKLLNSATKHFKIPGDENVYTVIPEEGLSEETIIEALTKFSAKEIPGWSNGFISGKVYNGTPQVIRIMNKVFEMYCVSNALHPEVFPSIRKFEAETIRMTAAMLGGDEQVCGTLTSGGTESILMAMKTYREYAKAVLGIHNPEVVMSAGAHAAFDKAEEYFGIKMIRTPINPDGTTNLELVEKSINSNTVGIVGSAPNYAHGSMDDILGLARMAKQHNILLHVDACLGGFIMPWIKKLGRDIKPFDFSVDGVSSMSCDTHKYGFGPKGESVLLFRDKAIRKHMFFVQADWNGGIYASPTVAGSRPGYPIAGTWAVMVATGQSGYMECAKGIMEARDIIVKGTAEIPELELICDHPTPVIAWKSSKIDIFLVLDAMKKRKWIIDPLQSPNGVHICLTVRQIGKGEAFVKDMKDSIKEIVEHPEHFKGGLAPVYGLAASVPDRSIIREFVTGYLDRLLDVTGAADADVASSSGAQ